MNDRIRPFRKVMAANRGEIAIRIFRACTELGLKTLAIYSHEDRLSIHRYKADEAFEVGKPGDPIGAYLDQEAILRVALARGVDAIHPGYGFLAENAAFAQRCAEVGIVFIGPNPSALQTFGDKTAARRLAVEAGVPVVPGLDHPVADVEEIRAFAASHGFPIMLKAAFGGGGRGMRVIERASEIEEAFARASGEAKAAFGNGAVFCERLIRHAKHIEVQLLADAEGHCVHLFERDCSIQRRHQKVIEVAPAVTLSETTREALYQAALRIARASLYVNAGTVEFLVEDDQFYFIEVNPRIQVEHTVTEQITGRDLVQAQIRVAQGYRLNDPEISIPNQAAITRQGVAIQLRITSEDPEKEFQASTGKIRAYRSAAGFGIRLDTGIGGVGTDISSDYDTLIVKLTATALTFPQAVAKASRSLHEFRIRGVKTNIPFLDRVLSHPVFLSGQTYTRFVDDNPDLTKFAPRRDRGTKLLKGLAHVVVNGPPGLDRKFARPQPLFMPRLPSGDFSKAPPDSPAMAVFRAQGAAGLSKWLKDQPQLLITDTTFRDAHQSLLATRVRTADMVAVAPATAHLMSDLFSVEMWGGATFDVAYRFLREDPWQRLDALRAAMPNQLLQMLFRGANAVGYTNYPDNVVRRFVRESARRGIDIFRIFDALNWLPNMALAIEEVAAAGKVAEASICYTGDILDPTRTKFTLDYYTQLAADLARHGAHIIAIKDMAGLLKPAAARVLIPAIHEASGLPVHLHTHDTSGNGLATYMLAADAGVDVVDCALSSVSGLTSQPSLNALLAALEHHPRAPKNLDPTDLQSLADYWERVRDLYYPFESGLKACTAEVYWHEIPGGQYSNLKAQAIALGLGERFGEIKQRYRDVNDALGDVIKVTPTSKMVSDFAMFLVQNDLTIDEATARADRLNFPKSVMEFFSGQLGQPPGGFPKVLRNAVLRGEDPPITGRAGESLPDHDFADASARLSKRLSRAPREDELLAEALYPAVIKEYLDVRDQYGDLSLLPTPTFLYGLEPGEEIDVEIEPGKTLIVKLGAVGDLNPQGQRIVYFELNGQPREVLARDLSVEADTTQRPQASPDDPTHIGASMPGKVIQVLAQPGQAVAASQTLIIVEAMKMETALKAPKAATIQDVLVQPGDRVQAGDLLMRISPT
jgi:pyruvate carboxylase